MLTAISRYGARVIPHTQAVIAELSRRNQIVQGPHIAAFEEAFAARLGAPRATTTSYGRMAFYYILKALQLPADSEVIVPALTFWVVPEIARVAGATVVFADVDPQTFTLTPEAFERAITPRTKAVVPTHLWGLPCDMDDLNRIARRHGIAVIEDCAHALGATYRGRPVGALGDASFFSFQTLKPLNTYGGGMALARHPAVAQRIADLAAAAAWPDEKQVMKQLNLGRLQRLAIRPSVFTTALFPVLWSMSWVRARPDVYLWENIRPLDQLPSHYTTRYSNVQAAIGLGGLEHLDEWTRATQANAAEMTRALLGVPGIEHPFVPVDRTHAFYQYCAYVPNRDRLVRSCIRRGLDIETLHADVCPQLPLFVDRRVPAPGAERAAEAVQVPIYASLTPAQLHRVAAVIHRTLSRDSAATRRQSTGPIHTSRIESRR
jgi:perosamine synthetase